MSSASVSDYVVPEHVHQDMVRPFDFRAGKGMRSRPHDVLATFQDGPRVFYNPVGENPDGSRGFWVPTRAQDLRTMLEAHDIFSSRKIVGYSGLMGENWDLIPSEKDPPDHTKYRKLVNSLFSPRRIKSLEGPVREHAARLIDDIAGAGACEFMERLGRPFPILIFMSQMGVGAEHFEKVTHSAHELFEGTSREERSRGAIAMGTFMREQIERVRATPDEFILSQIVHGRIDDRPLDEDEIIGTAYLLFIGGIHTVAASLGFAALHFGRDQQLQERVRSNPDDIPKAINELLRRYAVVNSFRRVAKDNSALGGVVMKAGDWVFNTLPMANLDKQEFADPLTVDIDRRSSHLAFAYGVHFCPGATLARMEMATAWQEWFARIPPFRVRESETRITSGLLYGVDRLVLEWE